VRGSRSCCETLALELKPRLDVVEVGFGARTFANYLLGVLIVTNRRRQRKHIRIVIVFPFSLAWLELVLSVQLLKEWVKADA